MPPSGVQKAITFSRRAPGQLTVLLVILVLVCLATGLAAALDVQRKRAVLTEVIEGSGQVTNAAVEIYQSLSEANATVASAFLVSGVEPAPLRERYQTNITEAAAALTTAAAGSLTGESAVIVTELAAYLPMYTGLVERARAYNRQGQPLGVSYIREASHLVQGTMLRLAQRLYMAETTRLEEAQNQAGVVGWTLLVVGFLVLGGLVAVQIYLTRTTRRVLNAGMLVATLAALAAVSWYAIATAKAADHSVTSQQQGSAAVKAFAEARIKVLEARSDEALTLVARGNGRSYEDHFVLVRDELNGGLLANAKAAASADTVGPVDNAINAWHGWVDSHRELRSQDDRGDYDAAIEMATNGVPSELYGTVDRELGTAIARAAGKFHDEAVSARGALSTADIGIAVLFVAAALAVWFGLAPRIREYR